MTEVLQPRVGLVQVHCQAPLQARPASLSPSSTEIPELSSGPKCCSAVATLPESPFLLSSSFQHLLPCPPQPMILTYTEKRSNQRPQAPTTASGILPLPSSKTATYQKHLANRLVTLPAPQNPFFQWLQGSRSLSPGSSRLHWLPPLCCLC